MMSSSPIIQINGLSKKFGKTNALDNVNLEVHQGKIIGLLGANGSGKSTLIRHIIGYYLPTIGRCTTFGVEADKLTAAELGRIGYVHQEGDLLDWMKVKQMIKYVAAYYPGWNHDLTEQYVKDFDLPMDKAIGTLSPGVRQKLAILLAIGFEPELLILDEPASGLDPIARGDFLDLLLKIIQDQNRTIIISSHILSDIEKVIDHTIVMDKGKIITDTTYDNLLEMFCRCTLRSLNGDLPDQLGWERIAKIEKSAKTAFVTVYGYERTQLSEMAKELNCDIEFNRLTLEEIYRFVVAKNIGGVQ